VIDFRYHLVSIVAVFLALGLGLLLGSTELAPKVARGLLNTSKVEKKQIDSMLATQHQLRQELSRNQDFAQAAERQLLGHLLAGQRVVLVTAPGASGGAVNGISQLLTGPAGAIVTGQVQLQQNMFDASSSTQQQLSTLAQHLATSAGLVLRPGSPVAQAGQVIASAILTKDGPGQPVAGVRDSAAEAVLNEFAAGGFLTTVSGRPFDHATLAVVIASDSPPSQSDSNPASQGLVTLAQTFQQAGQGTVVAGSASGSGPGSAIDVMRTGGRSGTMTSVDGADTTIGQIVVVQALYEQLNGVSGSYGWAPTATEAAPSPAPSPSSTPGAAAAATARGTPTPTGVVRR
jgi:Copper transport outer membrane protein, MctB